MSIQPFTIIPFTALVFYAILLWIVITRQVRTRLYTYFCLYLGCMIVWCLGAFMVFSEIPLFDTVTWDRLMIVGTMGMPIAFFGFVQVFLMRDWKTWLRLGLFAYVVTLIADTQDWLIVDAHMINGRLIFTPGWAASISVICWIFFLGFATYSLVQEYYASKDLANKTQIRHLLVVIAVIFAGAVTDAIPTIKDYPVDIIFNALAALLIANAILRHQFLDIYFVVRKGMFYSIPTAVIGAAYFLVITFVNRILPEHSDTQLFFVSLLVAVIAALIAQPIRDAAQNMIDRLFFREKYDSSRMLQRISVTAATVLDLGQLTQMILAEIHATLHIEHAAFFLWHGDTGEYYLMAERGLDPISSLRLSRNNPIVVYLATHNGILSRNDVNIQPQFRGMWGKERDDLVRMRAELLIPLKAKGEMVGILSVGEKMSGNSYTQDDHLTLTTLANQTAVAIENARLYSAEQFRREELDALYQLTRQLVATDDVGTVLESTTTHVVESLHVSFSWILTPKEDGTVAYRAAYPSNPMEDHYGVNRPIPKAAQRYFQEVLAQGEAQVVHRDSNDLEEETQKALMLDTITMLCISPLKVGDEAIGLLVLGNYQRNLTDPFDADKLRLVRNMADQAANALLRADLHEQMEDSFVQTVLALATAAESRDRYTHGHGERMVSLSEETARELGLPEEQVKALHWGANLHDIGKIGIPDEILNKPGPLSQVEWAVMQRHPIIGARIIAPVKKLSNVAPIIRAHHERYDGAGYPYGIKGDDIPLGARIVAVADAYTAMTDERVYRKACSHAEAVAELQHCAGTQFDPEVVEAFLRVLDRGVHLKMGPIAFQKDLSADKTKPIGRPFALDQ
jgi:HD-GYP domain-containing protein (c-di-GMP phosphodiesterase class II)